MPPGADVALNSEERAVLERWLGAPKSSHALRFASLAAPSRPRGGAVVSLRCRHPCEIRGLGG
jgi:hypothetical protein